MCLYLIPCFQSEVPSKQPETPDDVIAQKVKHSYLQRMQTTCSFVLSAR